MYVCMYVCMFVMFLNCLTFVSYNRASYSRLNADKGRS